MQHDQLVERKQQRSFYYRLTGETSETDITGGHQEFV